MVFRDNYTILLNKYKEFIQRNFADVSAIFLPYGFREGEMAIFPAGCGMIPGMS
jgi:hypothetical protein